MLVYIDLFLAMGFAWVISGIFLLWKNRGLINLSPREGILLLLTLGLTLLDNFLKPEMLPKATAVLVFAISRNSYFLIGPFLLFYTRSVLSSKNFTIKDYLHFLPFVLMLISVFFNTDILFPSNNPPHLPGFDFKALLDPEFYRIRLSIISRSVYCFLVFKLIRNHMKKVPEFYSYKSSLNTLSWLYYLVIIYLILFISNFLIIVFSHGQGYLFSFIITSGRIVPTLLFIFFFGLYAQNQSIPEDIKLPEPSYSFNSNLEQKTDKENKYKNSVIKEVDSITLYERLNKFLVESKLFTDPDLTLNTLANSIGETRHHISEVVNKKSGDNFYAYINGYRFREFITCITENRFPNFTITAIALECGFKSNSVFYSVFKKNTAMTPKEYIKSLNAVN